MITLRLIPLLAALLGLLVAGCDFPAPLTATPTRRAEAELAHDWTLSDASSDKQVRLSIRVFDESTYTVVYDGRIFRVFHSDLAALPFVSVQELDTIDRKYCFYLWTISIDGKQLALRRLNSGSLPNRLCTTADLQRAVLAQRDNPALFEQEAVFRRQQ